MFGAFGYGTDSFGRQVGANPRYNAQVLGQRAGDQLGLAQVDYARQQRAQQDALAMYGQAAQGLGPSAAQSVLRQGQDQAQANAMAVAASGRGGGLGGAQRGAMTAAVAGNAQASQAAAQLRAQEQQAAMQGYAGLGVQLGAQAQQQQQMQMGMQQGLLGMQFADAAARRDAAQRSREYKTQRNLGWSQYGTGVAGSVLGAIGGGG